MNQATPQSASNNKPNPYELLLTFQEARIKMKVSCSTFWRFLNVYGLPVIKVGGRRFIRGSALAAWLDSGR